MEYAKEKLLKIGCYNTNVKKLNYEKENWTSKIIKKIKVHKFITTIIILFLFFSCINIILIYNFMKILI